MSSDLRDLYQETILDHGRRPRNFRRIAGADRSAQGHNPLCGDRLTLYLAMDGDRVKDAAFDGAGCAISTASASLMTEAVKGRTQVEAEALFGRFHDMLTAPGEPGEEGDDEGLGKLAVFSGVREFPMRIKCATLAWHTLRAALDHTHGEVTTE
jgi:nitrogen fixation protein NifU and related proteins